MWPFPNQPPTPVRDRKPRPVYPGDMPDAPF